MPERRKHFPFEDTLKRQNSISSNLFKYRRESRGLTNYGLSSEGQTPNRGVPSRTRCILRGPLARSLREGVSFSLVLCGFLVLGILSGLALIAGSAEHSFADSSTVPSEGMVNSGSGHSRAAKFMGVGSCSSSNCHGAVSPRDATNVLQNEYPTWSKHDSHAKAYLSLLNEDSRTIAEHLGIAHAESDPLCLSCHATYVSDKSLQGEKFRVEDGVSCESCHGAAEKYIGPHTEEGATHARNVSLGMVDLASPDKRGAFCLSCHLGNEEKYVDHRLIGAGHPRLSFELDTFTALQPVHWDVDDDYKKRKEDYIPARAWLVGQIERASAALDVLTSKKRSRAGAGALAGPELTLLYCFNCHHSLTEDQWQRRSYGGRPGELSLNVSSLEISAQAMMQMNSALASKLSSQMKTLHTSADTEAAAGSVRRSLDEARTFALGYKYERGTLQGLIRVLASYGAASADTHEYPPFEIAEQIAMGISSVASTLSPDGSLHKREIDQIYSALNEPESFQPELFVAACQQLLSRL